MIIVPHTQHQTSSRSRALSDALRTTIADFRRREPKLTDAEIEAALERAHVSSHARARQRRRALVGALAALTVVFGAILLSAGKATAADSGSFAPVIVGGVVVVATIAAVLLRSLNES